MIAADDAKTVYKEEVCMKLAQFRSGGGFS